MSHQICPLRDLVQAAEADHARAKANAVFPNFAVRLRDRHWDRERAAAFVLPSLIEKKKISVPEEKERDANAVEKTNGQK
jgi:hypothetical protein